MTGTFYSNFSKRKNSTKQPTGGTQVTMYLKEGTSIEKPTFILSGDQFSYNYVSAFGHYYFVDDIKSVRNGVTEIDCSMDVLATYKSDIGSYSCLIERCSDLLSIDTDLADTFCAVKNTEMVSQNTSSGLSFFTPGGYYVLSVINNIGSGSGFTCYYIMDITNIEALARYVNTDWGAGASDFLQWVQATFLKTADSIIDCIWIPYAFSALDSSALDSLGNVKIGVDVVSTASGYRIKSPCIASGNVSVTVPHYYNDFRKASPYTQCRLFIPGYGMVDINPLDFSGDDTVNLYFDGDASTGDTVCYVKRSSGTVVATYTYNVGVSCPVGKVGADVTGFISSGIQTIGGMIMSAALPGAGGVAAGISATSSAINTVATAFGPSASVHGGKGGRAIIENGLDPFITSFIKYTCDPQDYMLTSGRPCMQYKQISGLSGYIKCSDASVPIAGMGNEKEAVNEYLNSGFYYE